MLIMKNLVYLFGILLAVVFLTAGANAQVVINEIQSRGVAGNLDWIEIYNPGDVAVNLGGYTIYDNGAGGATPTKPKKAFPASATIPAKGFYVIITDTADFTGDPSGFGLSSSGEKVWLHDTLRGMIVDTVTFGATATAAQSYGRSPDGGAWQVLNTITRGATNGGSTSIGSDGSVATDFALAQNYPNPFNPSTTIRFSVARESNVRLTVFNLLGQPVATLAEQLVNAGTHSFVFEATNLPSGVYVYRLDAGAATLTRTMMLLK
jgi:hypothetical protein